MDKTYHPKNIPIPITIADGVTKARYGLILTKFDPAPGQMTVVGMYDDLDAAKAEGSQRFAECKPGMAMIQDTKTGELLQAHNWHHDCLIWEVFKP